MDDTLKSLKPSRHAMPFYGILAVVVFCLALVTASVLTGKGRVRGSVGTPVIERSIAFKSTANGGFSVFDPVTGDAIKTYTLGEGAFIRSSIRSMSLNRSSNGVAQNLPYKLAKTAKGKLSLIDPETEHFIVLNAFGAVASDSYNALLTRQTEKEG